MIELFLTAFVSLFVIIDPPGCAPIFYGLTSEATSAHRKAMAIRAVLVASAIFFLFAIAGEPLLSALGIELSSFRIAGGIMLFFIAMDMVFEKRTQRREDRAQKIMDTPEAEDVSIFPMAMPMIAGPGSIATVMLLFARAEGVTQSLVVAGALIANLVLMAAALLLVEPIMKLVGRQVEAVITRLLGVILAAMAVQFVLDGLKNSHLF